MVPCVCSPRVDSGVANLFCFFLSGECMCFITPQFAKASSSNSHMRGPDICRWVNLTYPNLHWPAWTYHYILLCNFIGLYTYAAQGADILTPTTVVECVDNHGLGLYCRHWYRFFICWGCSSRIFYFSHWINLLSSSNYRWKSTHRFTFTPGVMSCTSA